MKIPKLVVGCDGLFELGDSVYSVIPITKGDYVEKLIIDVNKRNF